MRNSAEYTKGHLRHQSSGTTPRGNFSGMNGNLIGHPSQGPGVLDSSRTQKLSKNSAN